MAYIPRSGLFGFLLLLAALAPSAGMAASHAAPTHPDSPSFSSQVEPIAAESIEGRLRRISAALRDRESLDPAAPGAAESTDGKLAWVFANAPGIGFRNGGWGNGGGFRNGGWGNGGFRNGGWGNGGFRNGGWGNGGGFRNGGFLNRW